MENMRRIALLYHAGLIDRKQAVQLLILSAKPEDQQKLVRFEGSSILRSFWV